MRAKDFDEIEVGDAILLQIGSKITTQIVEEIVEEEHFLLLESGLDAYPNEDDQYIVWDD